MRIEQRLIAASILAWISGCDPASAGAASESADIRPRGGEEGPAIGRRWVLRDAEGLAVNAVVEPTCRANGPACVSNEVGHVGGVTPECVRVVWLDDQYVDLKYSMSTGRAEDCVATSPSIAEFGVYADPACQGPFYTFAELGIETAHRFTRRARLIEDEGVLYAQGTQLLTQQQWYGGQDCQANQPQENTRAPWVAVPDWALNALPSPPYVLVWE